VPAHARRIRVAAVALLLAWFFVDELRDAIPLWIPFLVLAALELGFVAGAWREWGSPRPKRGRPPQQVDVEELGGEGWREPVLLKVDGHDVWIPSAAEEPERPAAPARRPWAPFEGLAVLAVLALVLFVLLPERGWEELDAGERARTEALLSSEAARIAGHPARVRCDAEGEAVGVVQHADGIAEVGGTNALLTPAICYRLHRLATDGDEGSFSQTARAIAVLAHEAWHLQGVRNEGVANCYAFQSGVELGQRLGLSRGTAARMMRQQLAENAIQARAAPAYLVPAECRDGGELDLDPGTARFP
jgi:hypothetical protein